MRLSRSPAGERSALSDRHVRRDAQNRRVFGARRTRSAWQAGRSIPRGGHRQLVAVARQVADPARMARRDGAALEAPDEPVRSGARYTLYLPPATPALPMAQ